MIVFIRLTLLYPRTLGPSASHFALGEHPGGWGGNSHEANTRGGGRGEPSKCQPVPRGCKTHNGHTQHKFLAQETRTFYLPLYTLSPEIKRLWANEKDLAFPRHHLPSRRLPRTRTSSYLLEVGLQFTSTTQSK